MTPSALAGLTVLDLATFVAAPFCCTLLGEFGADVIKVEQPGRGDDLRRLGTPARAGLSYWWLVESRNKKSITCNLREPDGQALIKRLAASADIVAENFRPGTMERWGLGWDELRAVNAPLVMVRISAFGQTRPYRERPGLGRIAAAMGGLSYLSGYPDRPPVTPGTPTIPHYLAGALAAFGALAAIEHRRRTGEGQGGRRALRAHAEDARRDDSRARRHRLRARAHRLQHRVRRAAQPLPLARRPVDRHRVHE